MISKEEFAEKLNGRSYRKVITNLEAEEANNNELLVAFGYSDDNLELRGVVNDEYTAIDGTYQYFSLEPTGKLEHLGGGAFDDVETIETCGIHLPLLKIVATWEPEEFKDRNASWLITSNVPHATFDILEGDDLFCRGIVMEMQDIEAAIATGYHPSEKPINEEKTRHFLETVPTLLKFLAQGLSEGKHNPKYAKIIGEMIAKHGEYKTMLFLLKTASEIIAKENPTT